jgi:hypothetical protein
VADRPHRVLYVDGKMAAVDSGSGSTRWARFPPTLEFILADLRPNGPPDLASDEGQTAYEKAFGRRPTCW